MKFNQKEWAFILLMSGALCGWLIRMERLTTQLVEQTKNSNVRHDWAEKNIETLDKRVDVLDVGFSVMRSKLFPNQSENTN